MPHNCSVCLTGTMVSIILFCLTATNQRKVRPGELDLRVCCFRTMNLFSLSHPSPDFPLLVESSLLRSSAAAACVALGSWRTAGNEG